MSIDKITNSNCYFDSYNQSRYQWENDLSTNRSAYTDDRPSDQPSTNWSQSDSPQEYAGDSPLWDTSTGYTGADLPSTNWSQSDLSTNRSTYSSGQPSDPPSTNWSQGNSSAAYTGDILIPTGWSQSNSSTDDNLSYWNQSDLSTNRSQYTSSQPSDLPSTNWSQRDSSTAYIGDDIQPSNWSQSELSTNRSEHISSQPSDPLSTSWSQSPWS